MDQFEDEDGCLDPDNDQDRILDVDDCERSRRTAVDDEDGIRTRSHHSHL
jgi:hypothetical protein